MSKNFYFHKNRRIFVVGKENKESFKKQNNENNNENISIKFRKNVI